MIAVERSGASSDSDPRPAGQGNDSARDLEILIRSRYPVVAVDTLEEDRLLELLARVARRLEVPLYTWSRTQGLVREGKDQATYDTADPLKLLAHLEASAAPGVVLLADFHPYLEDPLLVRKLREALPSFTSDRRALVLSGHGVRLPPEIGTQGVPYRLSLPDLEGIRAELRQVVRKAALYDKYVGETERNLSQALDTADAMSPVVLWIDEIEKGFSRDGGEADGGVSGRLLGTFLTWLQERDSRVFVVATANDVDRLPPELLRKGRFDEIFFVDLPGPAERRAILALHLARRGRNADRFDLERLADVAEGFSGSELEQAVVAGLYTAFADKSDLDQETLLSELESAVPLSVTLSERVETLREWARGRAVPAA
jgi:hypothetical protein